MDDLLPPAPRRRPDRDRRFFFTGLLFETGLGIAALAGSWVCGVPLWRSLPGFGALALHTMLGVLAALPLVAGLLIIDRYPPAALRPLRDQVDEFVLPLFQSLTVPQLAALSAAAGWGEELLFRGLLQGGIQTAWDGTAGRVLAVGLASLVFGLCHFLKHRYAALATVVGFYFGGLLLATSSLSTPVAAHAVYDFLALLYLTRFRGEVPPRDLS